MDPEWPYTLAFARVRDIRAVRVRNLMMHFDSLKLTWSAGEFDLASARFHTQSIALFSHGCNTNTPLAKVDPRQAANEPALLWGDAYYPELFCDVVDIP